MIELLGSIAYETVRHSWGFSTVFIKYLALIGLLYSFRKESFLEAYREFFLEYSREAVTVIILAGIVSLSLGISFSPVLPAFSSIVAVIFYGYLFWKF